MLRPRWRKLAQCKYIAYDKYQSIGWKLGQYLWEQEQDSVAVTEEDLFTWYLEQIEADIEAEAQFLLSSSPSCRRSSSA